MAQALDAALALVEARGYIGELRTFDGCLNIRAVRGKPDELSTHAYGLAIDINAATNHLGQPPTISPGLVQCFTESGFSWGGTFPRVDGQHFSFAWE